MPQSNASAIRRVGHPGGQSPRRIKPVPPSRIEMLLSRLAMILKTGNFELAHRAIDDFAAQFSEPPVMLTRETPLADTELGEDMRILNALDRMGVVTVGQLCRTNLNRTFPGLGPMAMERLRALVESLRENPNRSKG